MRLCSPTNYCIGRGWLTRTRYREANRPSDRDRDEQQGGKVARWVAGRRGGNREDGGHRDQREGGRTGGGRPAAKDRGRG